MKIKSIKLTNFRNFADFKLDFGVQTVLVGPNGRGKTNILEAIYLLSTSKSFRISSDRELINWNESFARVNGKVEADDTKEIVLIFNKDPNFGFIKKVKIDQVDKKMFDMVGKLKTVLFSPEQLEIVTGSPRTRRRFLDVLISLTNKRYTRSLIELSRALQDRNKVLFKIREGFGDKDELLFWNGQLVEHGTYIIFARWKLSKFFNQILSEKYKAISDDKKDFKARYSSRVLENIKGEISRESIKKSFEDLIRHENEKEIRFAKTLFGPQRDNLILILDEKRLDHFGSRGEVRTAVLALKLAEIEFLSGKSNGIKPILLLDDVFSELDENRRHCLSDQIIGTQTVITTTDLSHLKPFLKKTAKIVRL